MSTGTAIVIVAVLGLMVYHRGFRRFVVWALIVLSGVTAGVIYGDQFSLWLHNAFGLAVAVVCFILFCVGMNLLSAGLQRLGGWHSSRHPLTGGRNAIAKIYGRPFPTENE